jgi:hypothetical protein
MNTQAFKTEMAVRYENHQWKGTVVEIGKEEIGVIFKGDGAVEHIDSMFMKSI